MKVGISISSSYTVADVRVGARWMIERAAASADAHLDSLFFGDHHVTRAPYYQNTPMLGRALAEWHDAPAGALYLLPFRHPVLLAEEVATLAALAPQQFIMQCGLGHGDREFGAFGIDPRHRPSRFEESLGIMRALWAGETVNHEGRWRIENAEISPTPPEPIEVWVAASADPAIERAGRLGDGWLAAPGLTLQEAKESLGFYRSSCSANAIDPGVTAIRRDVYVAETKAEAETVLEDVARRGYRGFPLQALVIGDVDSVAASFLQYAELGYTDVIVRNIVPDQERALACIHRLGAVRTIVSRQ